MPLVPVVLLLWPVAEIAVFVLAARAIGLLAAIALIVLAWPAGTWVIRAQGRAAWRRLQAAAGEGQTPGPAVLDGSLVLLGGLLLMVPGFLTDALALGLLLPPTRRLARGVAARTLLPRLVVRASRTGSRGPRRPADVDSTAVDLDQPRLSR